MTRTRRFLSVVVATAVSYTAGVQFAHAGLIGTESVALSQRLAPDVLPASDRDRLASLLNREDVAQALAERGVDIEHARARVAALSDDEASQLAQQIDTAPAGGDFLGVVVGLFVLLLITDILGFTKVFPFTRSIR